MTQPTALRLAAALSAAIKQVDADDDVIHVARWFVEDADAELRRLQALLEAEQALHQRVTYPELQRLRAQRDALLEALKMMRDKYGEYACRACDRADAAIKAVEGEKT